MSDRFEWMDIAMITDEGYAMPTGIAIFSLKVNRAKDSRYRIHVLGKALKEKTRERYLSMAEDGFEIDLIDVTQDAKRYKNVTINMPRVTTTALFKFDLPKYFPHLDKLLYIDGDVLIQHDLRSIYDTDVSDVYLAVVEDMKAMISYKPPILVKLQLNHKKYFHTGMMVMNLALLRQDNIPEKLLEYRINGINYFMDQDTFNAVTDERVVFLSPLTNYCFTLDNEFTSDEILSYYNIPDEPHDVVERQNKAIVFHLPGAHKPWRERMPRLTDLYLSYYNRSPFAVDLLRIDEPPAAKPAVRAKTKQQSLRGFLRSKNSGVNLTEPRDVKVTMSMTSFPARINVVAKTLVPLMNQTVKPDRIVLCLSPQEFPKLEAQLPAELLAMREHGLQILWGENLRPHTKYLHTMKAYPDDIVITVDDDIVYETDLVERLMDSYRRHPQAISAMRAHLMTFDSLGDLLPYRSWVYQCSAFVDEPLMTLFATGVGGVLYPPHLMTYPDTLDVEIIKEISLNNDDIWLKVMQTLCNVPVVLAAPFEDLCVAEGTQTTGLSYSNVRDGQNDKLMKAVLNRYNETYGPDDTLVMRMYKDKRIVSRMHSRVSPPKDGAVKRLLKKVLPIPTSGFMREISIVKVMQENTLNYISAMVEALQEQNREQQNTILRLEEKVEQLLAERSGDEAPSTDGQ